MGRLLKNPDIAQGALAARLPIVPDSTYGDPPTNGLIRFNQDTKRIQFYYNNNWNDIAKVGSVPIDVDTFTTYDGGSNQFTMSYSYITGQENNVLVFVGGVQQKPLTNYNFSSGVPSTNIYINPSTSGDANQTVLVIHNINSTNVPA